MRFEKCFKIQGFLFSILGWGGDASSEFRLSVESSDAVMLKMFLSLLDHPADCSSQELLIMRISDDFIPDDFMHLQNDDKITMGI